MVCALFLASCLGGVHVLQVPLSIQDVVADDLHETSKPGHITFESPHSNPIGLVPDGSLIYVANTPADTVDVIDSQTREIVDRIHVGIDPVGIAVRPDGKEVWVTNHVSDSVSVIDSDPSSSTFNHVLHSIQVIDEVTKSTRFDEPVGIAFASDSKAYVALSSTNQIAVLDVATREVTKRLNITAQDPRAIAIQGDRLYVIPFESNNQTAISGCFPENLDEEHCTFDAIQHVVEAPGGKEQSLSLGYVADIIRHPDIPDRDLYVFNTTTDELVQVVNTLGTLLYGIAVDSRGNVFVAQAEARNDANGKAGTEKHGLKELENRAFLNQITKVDCTSTDCGTPEFIELEPLPPDHPEPGMALATPFGIQISHDDSTLVATAAASNMVFTMDAASGEILGRAEVEAIPRGLTLVHDTEGILQGAWVLNALANSVSYIDLTTRSSPRLISTITLEDPTEEDLKVGRIAFNSAHASSTGTFACASCHPDGHTDQLLWVLDAPLCDAGCDQIQPRLVQDIRGLRGTAPYHWDGTLGDPFGGVNTASTYAHVEPNCELEDEESCTLHLVDVSLRTTMCDQEDCEVNDEGKPGKLSAAERDALSKYLLSVPYPPSVERPYTNVMTPLALEGVNDFQYIIQCGNCHLLPHWTTTNMGGSGMDLPSWRGASDRWKNAPQNRFFFADRVKDDTQGFPERFGFTNNRKMYQMILEGSVGFTGSFGRQVTLNRETASRKSTRDLLFALEFSAYEGGVLLQGEGLLVESDESVNEISLTYVNAKYQDRHDNSVSYTRDELLALANSGELLVTLTARLGSKVNYAHPQPTIWPLGLPIRPEFPGGRPAEFPELFVNEPIRMQGKYIFEDANIIVDGRKVGGRVECESGSLPDCANDIILVHLDYLPFGHGVHMLQVQNAEGLFSNDMPFFVYPNEWPVQSGNLIASGGTFDAQQGWEFHSDIATVTWNGVAEVAILESSVRPWHVQLQHTVSVTKDVEYSLCYKAKAEDFRYIEVNVDTGPDGPNERYMSLMGTGHTPEVGSATRSTGASLTDRYHEFHHRFVASETDQTARLNFTFAQSDLDVSLDDVGLYVGRGCGSP